MVLVPPGFGAVAPFRGGAGGFVDPEARRVPLIGGGGGAEDRRFDERLGADEVVGEGAREVAPRLAEFGSGALPAIAVLDLVVGVLSSESFSIWRSNLERLTGSFSCMALAKARSRCFIRSRKAEF